MHGLEALVGTVLMVGWGGERGRARRGAVSGRASEGGRETRAGPSARGNLQLQQQAALAYARVPDDDVLFAREWEAGVGAWLVVFLKRRRKRAESRPGARKQAARTQSRAETAMLARAKSKARHGSRQTAPGELGTRPRQSAAAASPRRPAQNPYLEEIAVRHFVSKIGQATRPTSNPGQGVSRSGRNAFRLFLGGLLGCKR